eukprot:s6992_g6.t1
MGGRSREATTATAPLLKSHGAANSCGAPSSPGPDRSSCRSAGDGACEPHDLLRRLVRLRSLRAPPAVRAAATAAGGGSRAVRRSVPWRPPFWAARGMRRRSPEWQVRSDLFVEELIEASPDVIALQEVMYELYEADLQPRLASLGYLGTMQQRSERRSAVEIELFKPAARDNVQRRNRCSLFSPVHAKFPARSRKDDHQTGNATFFRESRFEIGWEEHRSRVLLLGLRDLQNSGAERICVANAHLEGNPRKSMDRVSQVRSALLDASKHGGPQRHGLILCGDFNASAKPRLWQVCEGN